MPHSAPIRRLPPETLEQALANLFRRLRSEPAPQALLTLIDELEEAYQRSRVPAEQRTIA